jgi:ABC-type transport system substrate-binding protein
MNQQKRKELTSEVQQIVAEDLPYIPLWYADVVSVHQRSLGQLIFSPTGDYDFLAAP